ncbi:MAG TPA: hypothetical protein VD736_04310 [Nitrososphaera sp.]|nr:hypothetical protein [Nitrososphaera sp.]
MSSRILAFTLVALLVFGVSSMALTGSAFAQADDLWYPGEGVEQDMYYKYNIREYQTNNRQFFELTLYFQEQQDGDWIVPAFVVDEGKVIRGTWKLSDSMGYLAGSSQVPAEMNEFVGGYLGSLHWIDSFTTKRDPKSLSSGNWGRTGSIGGSDLKPSGQETITVPAGEYETTVLVLHKGQADSKIWVMNEFPFPIKALFFTDTTTGAPETQFEFELLETGKGKPEPPAEGELIPKPPLEGKTGRGTYKIGLDWSSDVPDDPAKIEPGSTVRFSVSLADSTGFPLERTNYDFTVKDSEGNIIQEFPNQNADAETGTGIHEVQLDSAGSVTVTVKINSVSGQDTGQFIESVDFKVVVIPEFPVSAALVAAAVIGLVIAMTRVRGGLGSLFGTKSAL